MRPPIQYFGSKANIADEIVALMPPHRGYIEPYAGSLAVLLAKSPARIEVVNDLDEKLITFWRVLRDRPHELFALAELTPHSRLELDLAAEAVVNSDNPDDMELARLVWVLLTQGRSRTMHRTGWRFYADPQGTSASFKTYMAAYRDRLPPAAARIRDVSLECRPALEVIAQYGAFPENLLYVDPPYLGSTRSTGRYSHEMPDNAAHESLATALHDCTASVMISGYPSPLYNSLYSDWTEVSIRARSDNASERERTEVVWMNFQPDQFLDFTVLDEVAL